MRQERLPQEYIVLDSNLAINALKQLAFDYAAMAETTQFKDVKMVMPRGLLAEYCNFALDESVTSAFSRYIPLTNQGNILKYRRHIVIPDFNEADIDFLHNIAAAFKTHLKPEMVPEDVKNRVQHAAWTLKKKLTPDSCPVNASEIDIFNTDDSMIIAALFSVQGTRKQIMWHIKDVTFNSADLSILAWYEDSLSRILHSEEDIQNRTTIFVSKDGEAIRSLRDTTKEHGNEANYKRFGLGGFLVYMGEQLRAMKEHVADNGSQVPDSVIQQIDELIARSEALQKPQPTPLGKKAEPFKPRR